MAGLILQSTPVDWWCLYWIHSDMDPSIYSREEESDEEDGEGEDGDGGE